MRDKMETGRKLTELKMETHKAKVAFLLHVLGWNRSDLELDTKK